MLAQQIDDLIAINAVGTALEALKTSAEEISLADALRLEFKAKLNNGSYADADTLSQRAVRLSPDNPEVHRLTGFMRIVRPESGNARNSFKRAVILNPDAAASLSAMSSACRHLGRLDESLAFGNRALMADPAHPDPYSAIVATRIRNGETQDQDQNVVRAILLKPFARNLYALASHLGSQNQTIDPKLRERLLILDRGDLENQLLVNLSRAGEDDGPRGVTAGKRVAILDPANLGAYTLLKAKEHWAEYFADPIMLLRIMTVAGSPPKPLYLRATRQLNDVGRQRDAIAAIKHFRARHDPDDADLLFNLSVAYRSLKEYPEAERIARKLVNGAPDRKHGWLLLSNLLIDQNQKDKALRIIKRAVTRVTDDAALWFTYGNLALRDENYPMAVKALRKTVYWQPTWQAGYSALARAYEGLGRDGKAAKFIEYGLRLSENTFESISASAELLISAGKWKEGLIRAKQAYIIDPTRPESNDNLTNGFLHSDDVEAAHGIAKRFVLQHPKSAISQAIYSVTLARNGQPLAALKHIKAQLTEWPASTRLMKAYNIITVLSGDPEKQRPFIRSIAYLQKVSGSFTAYGMAELHHQNWGLGFDFYDSGLDQKRRGRGPRRIFEASRWHGEDLTGKTILVHTEQGVGDELMFGTLIPDLVKIADKVIIEVTPRLVPLFARSFPSCEVISWKDRKETRNRTDFDYFTPVGSIGRFTRRETKLFGRQRPYLEPDIEKARALRHKYTDGDPSVFVVGLGWQGGSVAVRSKRRSVGLDYLAPALDGMDCRIVSVQYGDVEGQIAQANKDYGTGIVFDPAVDPLKDLEASAAQIAACDLIISATNAGVHTAGALGVPCWTMVPIEADWRWTWPRSDVVWYPGMRLYRQTKFFDWDDPVNRIRSDLTDYFAADPHVRSLRAVPEPSWNWS